VPKTIPLPRKKSNQLLFVTVFSFVGIFIGMMIFGISIHHFNGQKSRYNNDSVKSQDLIKSFFSQKGSGK
jgi:ABC-type lipoprotein release transport system permease subunit